MVCGLSSIVSTIAVIVTRSTEYNHSRVVVGMKHPTPSLSQATLLPLAQILHQITGANGRVPTLRGVDVWGCDLGILASIPGSNTSLALLFGDTFGAGSLPGDGTKKDWRSNSLAVSTAVNNLVGHTFGAKYWVTNSRGVARALIQGRHDTTGNSEISVIPSTLWSNSTHFVGWFASVRQFNGDEWFCNNATVATASSNINISQWTLHSDTVRWSNNSHFQQFAVVRVQESTVSGSSCDATLDVEKYLYLFATKCGRKGAAYILRVSRLGESLIYSDEYEYFAGLNASGWPHWSSAESDAVPAISTGVGELSVLWCADIGRFIMTYTAPSSRVVGRSSTCLWTGWEDEKLLLTQQSDGEFVYGGFAHPFLIRNNSYFFMVSKWQSYNTYLARVNLSVFA